MVFISGLILTFYTDIPSLETRHQPTLEELQNIFIRMQIRMRIIKTRICT